MDFQTYNISKMKSRKIQLINFKKLSLEINQEIGICKEKKNKAPSQKNSNETG